METINPRAPDWLPEEDEVNAPIRYMTLSDIFDRQKGDSELESARKWVNLRVLCAVKNFYEKYEAKNCFLTQFFRKDYLNDFVY